MTAITAEQLAVWKQLADAATEDPWLYRPKEFDDWGFVRAARSGRLVLIGRAGDDDADLDAHRRAKTDPYGPNAKFAVAARTAVPALIAEVERLREALSDMVNARRDLTIAKGSGTGSAIIRAEKRIDAAWSAARAVLPEEPADG